MEAKSSSKCTKKMETTRIKRALVTGGNRGIGLAITKRLMTNGYEVMSVSKQRLDLDNPSGHFNLQADLGTMDGLDSVRHYLKKVEWETLDVLVNNAGIAKALKIEDTSYFDAQELMAVNYLAPMELMKTCLPLLKANGGGSIINITSISGLTGFSTMSAYCASKHALAGFSMTASKEFAKHNVRVNIVAPGPCSTGMWNSLNEAYKKINGWKDDAESEQAYLSKLLIKRLATPEDVASAVEYLVDDSKSSYTTGMTLTVCGGGILR